MITIKGHKFAENRKETIESLFKPGPTATFQAKRHKRRILLYWANGEPMGVIQNGLIGKASRLPNGEVWYSYGTPEPFGELSLADERAIIEALSLGRDHKGHIFKMGARQ